MHIIFHHARNVPPEMSPLNPPLFIILQFFLTEQQQFYRTLTYMTDIKEPINTTSDATFLSVLCENPKKVLLAKSWGVWPPPRNYPPDLKDLVQFVASKSDLITLLLPLSLFSPLFPFSLLLPLPFLPSSLPDSLPSPPSLSGLSGFLTCWILSGGHHTTMYFSAGEHGYLYLVLSSVLLFLWLEASAYYIHMMMHKPFLYKTIHKHHHRYVASLWPVAQSKIILLCPQTIVLKILNHTSRTPPHLPYTNLKKSRTEKKPWLLSMPSRDNLQGK